MKLRKVQPLGFVRIARRSFLSRHFVAAIKEGPPARRNSAPVIPAAPTRAVCPTVPSKGKSKRRPRRLNCRRSATNPRTNGKPVLVRSASKPEGAVLSSGNSAARRHYFLPGLPGAQKATRGVVEPGGRETSRSGPARGPLGFLGVCLLRILTILQKPYPPSICIDDAARSP